MNTDDKALTISFLGDIALNNYYINLYKDGLNPFSNIQSVLSASEYVIGNLECMAKGDQGENLLKNPRLSTTEETLNYLNTLNVNMVSLAHNHIFDHLEDGFIKTTAFLKNNKISFLGSSLNENEEKKPIILSQNDIKIGFLNFVTEDTNPNIPLGDNVYLNIFDLARALIDIKLLKEEVDHIVLLFHWGGKVEGSLYPDFDQPNLARKLIDAGVDLIIGHHSHTLQPYEIYEGKYIFYSLGNFCFSNIISDEKIQEIDWNRNAESVILNVTFKKDNYFVDYVPINNNHHFLSIDSSVYRKWKRRAFFFNKFLHYLILSKIYHKCEKLFYPIVFYFFGNNRKSLNQLKNLLKTIQLVKIKNHIKKTFYG